MVASAPLTPYAERTEFCYKQAKDILVRSGFYAQYIDRVEVLLLNFGNFFDMIVFNLKYFFETS